MQTISERLTSVRQRIKAACADAGRPEHSVQLLAVSKTQPVEAVREAVACGQRCFGENYVQEALTKIEALQNESLEWHFIGPLQSNKTRMVSEAFNWVHSVERIKIARRLDEQRPSEKGPLNVCLQVNISGEATKSGVNLAALPQLAAGVAQLPNLRLRGLMAIPAPSDDKQAQRQVFARLRQAFEQLQADYPTVDTLSMGMSGDLEAAVAEGSTQVRIGTALFGPRNYTKKD